MQSAGSASSGDSRPLKERTAARGTHAAQGTQAGQGRLAARGTCAAQGARRLREHTLVREHRTPRGTLRRSGNAQGTPRRSGSARRSGNAREARNRWRSALAGGPPRLVTGTFTISWVVAGRRTFEGAALECCQLLAVANCSSVADCISSGPRSCSGRLFLCSPHVHSQCPQRPASACTRLLHDLPLAYVARHIVFHAPSGASWPRTRDWVDWMVTHRTSGGSIRPTAHRSRATIMQGPWDQTSSESHAVSMRVLHCTPRLRRFSVSMLFVASPELPIGRIV